MPVYEYMCPHCGDLDEVALPVEERNSRRWCTHCLAGGKMDVSPMVRVVSRTSFVLRGSGWSSDGYGSKR